MSARKPPRQLTYFIDNRDGRNPPITLAALHESVGATDALSLAKFCGRAGVSYHAAVDNEKIVYMVPRSWDAWHLRNGNPRSDGLCLCTPVAGYSPAEWLGPQRRKLDYTSWWLAIICADRGIDILRCSHQNIRDALRGDVRAGGCIEHHDYTLATGDGTHTDPRGFNDEVWDYVLTGAQQLAGYIDAQNKDAFKPPEDEMNDEQDARLRRVEAGLRVVMNQLCGPQADVDDPHWDAEQVGWPVKDTTGSDSRTLVDHVRAIDHRQTHGGE